MSEKTKRITNDTVIVILILVLSKVLGLFKQILAASLFGATISTDIINLSQDFFANIDYVFSQVIVTAFTTIYIYTIEKDEEKAKRLIIDTLKVFVLFSLVCTLIAFFASPLISRVLAPSYSQENLDSLSKYLKLYSFSLVLLIPISVLSSILNARKRFILRELAILLQNVVLILAIYIFADKLGVNAFVVATYSYIVISIIYLAFFTRKYVKVNKDFVFTNPFKSTEIKALFKMALPLLIGYSMVYINQQVAKIVVSGFEEGTVTALGYANVLFNLVNSIVLAVLTIVFTHITSYIANDKREEAFKMFRNTSVILLTAIIPACFVVYFFSKEIVTVVFGYGHFGEDAIVKASTALLGYSFCFIPFLIKSMLVNYQFSNKSTKWVTINSCISIGANVGLCILLGHYLGVFGVTLATTISESICAVANLIIVKWKYKEFVFSKYIRFIILSAIGCGLCFLVNFLLSNYMPSINPWLTLVITAFATYGAFGVCLLPEIISFIKSRSVKNEQA